MAVRKPHIYQQGYYFITFTNTNWLPLIQLTNAYDLIYSWFDYLKQHQHYIVSYVIMPNHIHLMLAYKGGVISLNTLVGNGKRFIGQEIIKRLKADGAAGIFRQLEEVHNHSDIRKEKRYAVFKTSFDVILCYTQKFIQQKINYIHANPCSKKWMLAPNASDYLHSSACYYETGKQGAYPVISTMELEATGWWAQPSVGMQ
jgi:REP element-mobilizing transposase RayT